MGEDVDEEGQQVGERLARPRPPQGGGLHLHMLNPSGWWGDRHSFKKGNNIICSNNMK